MIRSLHCSISDATNLKGERAYFAVLHTDEETVPALVAQRSPRRFGPFPTKEDACTCADTLKDLIDILEPLLLAIGRQMADAPNTSLMAYTVAFTGENGPAGTVIVIAPEGADAEALARAPDYPLRLGPFPRREDAVRIGNLTGALVMAIFKPRVAGWGPPTEKEPARC